MRVEKFVISKLIKPVIQNNKVYYEVKWKKHKDTTLEPRQTLLKDIPKIKRMRLQEDITMEMIKEI